MPTGCGWAIGRRKSVEVVGETTDAKEVSGSGAGVLMGGGRTAVRGRETEGLESRVESIVLGRPPRGSDLGANTFASCVGGMGGEMTTGLSSVMFFLLAISLSPKSLSSSTPPTLPLLSTSCTYARHSSASILLLFPTLPSSAFSSPPRHIAVSCKRTSTAQPIPSASCFCCLRSASTSPSTSGRVLNSHGARSYSGENEGKDVLDWLDAERVNVPGSSDKFLFSWKHIRGDIRYCTETYPDL